MNEFNDLMKLGRKLAKKGFPIDDKAKKIKIAVLGSSSIQHFVFFLRSVLYKRGIYADIYEGEYNGITMDVYDKDSALYQFAPDYVLILTHYTDIKEYPALLATKSEVESLKTPVTVNTIVLQEVSKAFDKYANGNGKLDEVVKSIGDNIDLILAE